MIEIFILSLIQGITEFLPISSSSHLILISDKLNFKNQALSIDVSLHIGSFFAVIFYFRKDVINFFENKILFFKVLISSIPVMVVGYFLIELKIIEQIRNIEVIAWTTTLFGILLYISDKFEFKNNLKKDFSYKVAFLIGLFQVLALVPGVSRSGIVITAARFFNFNRVDSTKISFLLSIPTLAYVSIYGLSKNIENQDLSFSTLNIISIVLSFIFSLITIKYFLQFIKKFSLKVFVIYRILLGMIILYSVYL